MEEEEKKKIRTMDVILIVIAIFLLVFIVLMLWMHYKTGGIPDTLCNGDMHAALDYAKKIKHEQKDFLQEQAVHALI